MVNNGAYNARAVEVCEMYHIPHINLKFSVYEQPQLDAVEEALKANPDVAVVYCCHHETGTGILNPIREIGALAHQYGAIFVSDTTSSLGMIPLDVVNDNVDFCMASAQKGLMAMSGLSFIIGRTDIIKASKTTQPVPTIAICICNMISLREQARCTLRLPYRQSTPLSRH